MDGVDAVDKVDDVRRGYSVHVVHAVYLCRDPALTWRDPESGR